MSEGQSQIQRRNGWTGTPLSQDDTVVALKFCPRCKGRGWFLINPFATGGTNGAGGLGNMTQCSTCKHAESYFREHGKMPEELQAAYEEWMRTNAPSEVSNA